MSWAAAIRDAHLRIAPYIHRTPVLTNTHLDSRAGASLFFKCENFQKVGAFKARGAFNAVMSLDTVSAAAGVVTHSSGNHAAALALAARMRGIAAHIVMPSNSPTLKKQAVAGYGGRIVFCEPTLDARERTAEAVRAETGATFIHPYDDNAIIAGQATAAVELLEEVKGLDTVVCPVGGGGLLAGSALATKWLQPGARVIAAEPAGADDAWRSFHARTLIPQSGAKTIADGLLTSLGKRNFAIMQDHVDAVLTVSEAEIVSAMKMVWQYMKIVVEPSAAVALAAVLSAKLPDADRIGIILSGGNVDLDHLPWQA